MADQLDEYRKRMQQRYRGGPSTERDEEVARKMQEDESRRRAEQQMKEDEELARKLQGSYPGPQAYAGTPVYPPNAGYSPPDYQAGGPPAAYPGANPYNQYPPANYPPPANYSQPPPANYNQYPPQNYQAMPAQRNYQNAPAQGNQRRSVAGVGCLPEVNDKCCGVNTQVCVLISAAVMTVGIIATLIGLSA
jgi:hypothetical protein